ncbi:MAG TPA: hypothetical protein VK167_05280 [Flavipsychrobacter sp.]|nr:hypothetical protein [Flavipsychrobacter sp.]
MSKTPKKDSPSNEPNLTPSGLSIAYEVIGLILISVAFILVLAHGVSLFNEPKQQDSPTTFYRVEVPQTDNVRKLLVNNKQADSIIVELYNNNVNLKDSVSKINSMIESIRIENKFTENKIKIYASIIAMIIAVVGFFGFKSLNDVREHSIKRAEFEAQKTAKEEANKTAKITSQQMLSEEILGKLHDEAYQRARKLYEEPLGDINQSIKELDRRLLAIENRIHSSANFTTQPTPGSATPVATPVTVPATTPVTATTTIQSTNNDNDLPEVPKNDEDF